MQQITTPDDVKRLGTILSVWAHPDDESYLAAGVMASAIANGQQVVCVTATKGEAGSQDHELWPPEYLDKVRARELYQALQELGVHRHAWLGCQDGNCQQANEHGIAKLKKLVEQYHPDTIITFGPDGLTGHPDHKAVSGWVNQIAEEQPGITVYHAVHTPEQYSRYLKRADAAINIFFNIEKPPLREKKDCAIALKLTPEICNKKCNALAAMPSQTQTLLRLFGHDFIKQAFANEYFVRAN